MSERMTAEQYRAVHALLSMGEELVGYVNEAYLSTGGERGCNLGRRTSRIRQEIAEYRKVLLT